MAAKEELTLRLAEGMDEIPAAHWDACAGGDNPFLSHAFLSSLEESGSVRAETGWLPQHLLLSRASGELIGAVPLYVKSHSWGEYVFDQNWADAYERAGGEYYPKLQAAVPFTPVPGARLLVRPDAPGETPDLLADGLIEVAKRFGVSSLHVTFPSRADWDRLGARGFSQRIGQQFHWENAGYASFDDFLAALNARKRKSLRRERQSVAESGLVIRTLSGGEIEPAHWSAFYRFYQATVDRKWGSAYLTRSFFRLLGERLGDKVVLMLAERDGKPVAGALNLRGADTLYGRNWGATEDVPFLHFELCYYRAIDYAIAQGLKRVEAGAQGEHKIQRGYLPAETYSAHWFRDPGLGRAVDRFLVQERQAMRREIEALAAFSPFRANEGH